ncbi:MAG: hypothetical protein R2867_20695 [Caldilineaceae bacterium]
MTDSISISRKNFVQIVGNRASYYPNPDDPGDPHNPFGPYGPHGPVLHRLVAFQRLRQLDRACLEPTTLPPKEALAFSLARAALDHVTQITLIATLLPDEVGEGVRGNGERFLGEFSEWCGTMTRWEIIQELLRRLHGRKPPPPPPPEPWWDERMDAFELITIGVQLQAAFERIADERLAESLDQIGSKLMDVGLNILE